MDEETVDNEATDATTPVAERDQTIGTYKKLRSITQELGVEIAEGIFEPFPKIKRWFRDVVITEKIDGTNGVIFFDEKGRVGAGSKRRWVFPIKGMDNAGFARWVYENAANLFKVLGPGKHFGEWFGQGIQRGYGLEEKRFALFNVNRWGTMDEFRLVAMEGNVPRLTVVPILWQGPMPLLQDALIGIRLSMMTAGSTVVPGYDKPEGIVFYHTHMRTLSKYTFDDDGNKGSR